MCAHAQAYLFLFLHQKGQRKTYTIKILNEYVHAWVIYLYNIYCPESWHDDTVVLIYYLYILITGIENQTLRFYDGQIIDVDCNK